MEASPGHRAEVGAGSGVFWRRLDGDDVEVRARLLGECECFKGNPAGGERAHEGDGQQGHRSGADARCGWPRGECAFATEERFDTVAEARVASEDADGE